MGIVFRSLHLMDSEKLLWEKFANRTQGRRSVGGRLYLTNTRLIFQPHRLDAALNGQSWIAPLNQIQEVVVEPPDGGRFNGGMRTRLLIRTDAGTDHFVVNHVETAVDQIKQAVTGDN
jgi:hypothetical protein